MIPHHIESRRRNQSGQLPYQIERIKNHMRGAVAPMLPEAIQEAAARKPRQSLRGHGWAEFEVRNYVACPEWRLLAKDIRRTIAGRS